MSFEAGCLPKCTMGQPDVLPANMDRLTASLEYRHTCTYTGMEADKQHVRELNGLTATVQYAYVLRYEKKKKNMAPDESLAY